MPQFSPGSPRLENGQRLRVIVESTVATALLAKTGIDAYGAVFEPLSGVLGAPIINGFTALGCSIGLYSDAVIASTNRVQERAAVGNNLRQTHNIGVSGIVAGIVIGTLGVAHEVNDLYEYSQPTKKEVSVPFKAEENKCRLELTLHERTDDNGRIQTILNEEGYYPYTIDKNAEQLTVEAINNFRDDNGLTGHTWEEICVVMQDTSGK